MEISRKLVIVYYNNSNCLKKISSLGNLIYHSNKLHYAYLYVNEKNLRHSMDAIKQINGVTKVELSLSEMGDYSFNI